MALISCPVCDKDVSERAPACPHCGHPIAQESQTAKSEKVIIEKKASSGCLVPLFLLLLLLAGICLVAVVTKPNEFALKNALLKKYGLIYGAGVVAEKFGLLDIRYNDHLVYSSISVQIIGQNEQTVAYGVFGNVIIAEDAISRLKQLERPSKQPAQTSSSQTQSTQSQVGIINNNCFVFNNTGGMVKLRRYCDTRNCEQDSSTLYTEVPHNTQLGLLNLRDYNSGRFTWRPVAYNNEILWISSTRLACQ
jgi:hypothetical protein